LTYYNKHLFICTNQKNAGKQCCANFGSEDFFVYLKSRLQELDLYGAGKIRLSKSGCLGRCSLGPCIVVYPEGLWFNYSSRADIDQIITDYLISGKTVPGLSIETNEP
jgi:(2Fe-2S) ferredoxin